MVRLTEELLIEWQTTNLEVAKEAMNESMSIPGLAFFLVRNDTIDKEKLPVEDLTENVDAEPGELGEIMTTLGGSAEGFMNMLMVVLPDGHLTKQLLLLRLAFEKNEVKATDSFRSTLDYVIPNWRSLEMDVTASFIKVMSERTKALAVMHVSESWSLTAPVEFQQRWAHVSTLADGPDKEREIQLMMDDAEKWKHSLPKNWSTTPESKEILSSTLECKAPPLRRRVEIPFTREGGKKGEGKVGGWGEPVVIQDTGKQGESLIRGRMTNFLPDKPHLSVVR